LTEEVIGKAGAKGIPIAEFLDRPSCFVDEDGAEVKP